jgi:hypothetical protein
VSTNYKQLNEMRRSVGIFLTGALSTLIGGSVAGTALASGMEVSMCTAGTNSGNPITFVFLTTSDDPYTFQEISATMDGIEHAHEDGHYPAWIFAQSGKYEMMLARPGFSSVAFDIHTNEPITLQNGASAFKADLVYGKQVLGSGFCRFGISGS